jgi:hypothetical protein
MKGLSRLYFRLRPLKTATIKGYRDINNMPHLYMYRQSLQSLPGAGSALLKNKSKRDIFFCWNKNPSNFVAVSKSL